MHSLLLSTHTLTHLRAHTHITHPGYWFLSLCFAGESRSQSCILARLSRATLYGMWTFGKQRGRTESEGGWEYGREGCQRHIARLRLCVYHLFPRASHTRLLLGDYQSDPFHHLLLPACRPTKFHTTEPLLWKYRCMISYWLPPKSCEHLQSWPDD